MERRSFVQGAGIAGVLAAGIAPAVHAQAAIRWRLTSSFPKSLDTLFGVNDTFAQKMKEMSGGKFTITTHPPGELVPAFGTIDAVKDGTVEMANTAPYYYFGKDPTFALSCAIPFGLNARQMAAWYYEGNGLKLMREFYKRSRRARSTPPSGWARTTTRSSASTRWRRFTPTRAGGKAVPASSCTSTPRPTRACRPSTRR